MAPMDIVPGIEDASGVRLSRPQGEKSKVYLELTVPLVGLMLRHS